MPSFRSKILLTSCWFDGVISFSMSNYKAKNAGLSRKTQFRLAVRAFPFLHLHATCLYITLTSTVYVFLVLDCFHLLVSSF